jgi:metal-responsive CopG/Arc/MetJ family transcriptional regulator
MSDIPPDLTRAGAAGQPAARTKVVVAVPRPLLDRIDNYIAGCPEPKPNRAMAIRQLLRRGLSAKDKGKAKA